MKPKIAIVSFPWQSHAPYKFLSDILKILESVSGKIVLIGGNTDRIKVSSKKIEIRDIGLSVHYLEEIRPTLYSAILWGIKCFLAQIKAGIELIKVKKNVEIVIFYMAYPYYLLPLLISKFLRKKTIEVVTRSEAKADSFLLTFIRLQDILLFWLIDGISPETKAIIDELDLWRYQNKLLPEGARFIDISKYFIKKKINERKNIVGYIGRLEKEKGIVNFIRSFPLIKKESKDIEFLIGGKGKLLYWVQEECKKIEDAEKIKTEVLGFIKEEEFVDYLNELKLLVLPTQHAEGLPTIILEAMACGTPILATQVGGIRDIIKDQETGFIMDNNSPECIAKNIIRSLNYPDLDRIVKNARDFIEKKYTYEKAVRRYKEILKGVQ